MPINVNNVQTTVDNIVRPQAQRQQRLLQQQQQQQQISIESSLMNQILTTPGLVTQNESQLVQQQDNFAPVSSIRPVKRNCKGGKGPSNKRMRHHSAQSALSSKVQVGRGPIYPLLQHSKQQTLMSTQVKINPHQQQTFNQVAGTEQPYSPEIKDIMSGGDPQMGTPVNSMINRSQSVPVPEPHFNRGFEFPDIFNNTELTNQNINSSQNTMLQENLVNEIQNLQYQNPNVRRNLNNLLASTPQQTQQIQKPLTLNNLGQQHNPITPITSPPESPYLPGMNLDFDQNTQLEGATDDVTATEGNDALFADMERPEWDIGLNV